MNAQRWLKIRELFESACDLGPKERQAMLAEACRGDRELRSEVESILDSSEESPALLESPAAEAFPHRAIASTRPGSRWSFLADWRSYRRG